MADESLREIQFNGKQLVFVFMASTVAAVVIFLCGVMVGRGVRTHRGELAAIEAGADPTADLAPSTAFGQSDGASPASNESLTYPDRLADDTAAPEVLGEPDATPPDPTAVARKSVRPEPVAEQPRTAAPEPASSDGFSVQVAAIRVQQDAERMAKRLTAKGYPAYVTTPSVGAPGVYRVRVGRFKERHEAEAVAVRLEKEEQFKPWVTR
jgi:cell division septation protein DedD